MGLLGSDGYSTKPTKYRYLRNLDLVDGEIKIGSVKFISEGQHESIERYQVFENEIVITIAGTVGKLSLIPKQLEICNVTENLAVIPPKASIVPKYLLYLLSSSIVQIQIQKEMSELRQQKLGLAKVRNLRIPKPPSRKGQLEMADAISEEIDKMRDRKEKVQDLLSRAIMTVEGAVSF